MSHEIRTPLNAVFMGLQLLPETLAQDPSDDLKELCHDLTSACSTAIDMLNDLLLIDKIEDGRVVLDKTVVSFSRFLRRTVRIFSMQVNPFIVLKCNHFLNTLSLCIRLPRKVSIFDIEEVTSSRLSWRIFLSLLTRASSPK